MTDIVLEVIRAFILLGIVIFLWRAGRSRFQATQQGWGFILGGFGLLLFGSVLDITDNFESLNRFVVIGDTKVEAFLEKFVGFLAGFFLLAIGLFKWMPGVQNLSDSVDSRTKELQEKNESIIAEIAKRKSGEERFQRYFNMPLTSSAIYNAADKRWIEINDTFCQFLGYSREALMELTWVDLTHPDDLEENLRFYEAALSGAGNDFYSMDKRFIRKDGEIVWATIYTQCIRKRDGTPDYFMLLIEDLTERNRIHEMLTTAIEAIPEGFMLLNAEDQLVLVNQNFKKIYPKLIDVLIPGTPYEDILWAGIKSGQFANAKGQEKEFFEDRMNRHRNPEGPVEFITDDGLIILVEERKTQDGGTVGIRTDVTKLKQIEHDLRESEERFRHLIEGSVQGVLIHNFFKPVFVNQAYADILGYESPEEILAQDSALDHVAPDDQERLQAYGDARLHGKEVPESYKFKAIKKDGSIVWVENRVRPITWDGRPANQRTIVDITERMKIEQMKSEFVSTVSHELRTPLTSIKGALGLVKMGVIGDLPDKLKSMLDIAYANSDRLERLINDILDIEKIEAGKMDFHLVPLNIVELVEKAIEANKGYGDKHRVTFVLKDTPPEKAMIEADEDRLMQVLSNLMSNAAKFSPEGGRVEVSVSSGVVGVRVSVTDYGPGISPEFQDRIFEKFSQADSSDSRQKGGTGLGLSITKAIIEHHDGILGFDTEVGKGATFYFVLPALVELGAKLINTDGMASQYRALIVEDEPDIAMILELMLRQDGFTTSIARNAAQAKEMLAKDNYDVMTLDLGLPDQNGISLIHELREQTGTKNLPIVVVSATASEAEKELNGDAFGIIDWLQKPIDPERLRESIRYATQSASSRRLRILHVEDDTDVLKVVSNVVNETAHITSARTLRAAKKLLGSETFDLVILDLMLPDGAGESLLPLLHRQGEPSIPVIVFSAKEASKEIAHNIEAVLLKSRTTNEVLLEAIRSAIHAGKGEV